MAATDAANHKFIEMKPLWVGKVGASGVASAGATTVPVASAAGLTNGNVYVVTANRTNATGTIKNPAAQRETFIAKLSGTDLINAIRGAEGTAQAWEADTVLEILVSATTWNKMVEGIETEHNQDGSHKKVTGMSNNTAVTQKDTGGTARAIANLNSNNVLEFGVGGASILNDAYLVDSGSANALAVTASPVPLAYATGMHVRVKAANDISGACTINVNSLGTKSIKNTAGADPGSGDIKSGGVYDLIYTGTNFLLLNPTATNLVTLSGTQTLTNKRVTKRITSVASSATPTPDIDTTDQYNLTALAADATFGAPTGTPQDGDVLVIRIKDNGSARALSWNAAYRAGTDVALPTTTVLSKTMYCVFKYNSADSKYDLLDVVDNI